MQLLMTRGLDEVIRDVLRTPGAGRVVVTWVDGVSGRVCQTEVEAGMSGVVSGVAGGMTEGARVREMYVVGRFALKGYCGEPAIGNAVNAMRARAGLEPLEEGMLGLLRPEGGEWWSGAVKVLVGDDDEALEIGGQRWGGLGEGAACGEWAVN